MHKRILETLSTTKYAAEVRWPSSDARREREMRTTGGSSDLRSPIERETQTTGEGSAQLHRTRGVNERIATAHPNDGWRC